MGAFIDLVEYHVYEFINIQTHTHKNPSHLHAIYHIARVFFLSDTKERIIKYEKKKCLSFLCKIFIKFLH